MSLAALPRRLATDVVRPNPDVALYVVSAAIAAGCLLSAFPSVHMWGAIALPTYVAASACRGRDRRTVLAVVIAGAAAIPLLTLVVLRQRYGSHWTHSEVLVIEHAARTLIGGGDPYAHGAGDLGVYAHFPYLPVMLGFGLPHAGWASAITDARLVFAVLTAVTVGVAVTRSGWRREHRLLVLQVVVASPLGALTLATGGDDLPVLGLILLAVVAFSRAANGRGWLALLVAALTKATAWPVLLAFVLAGHVRLSKRTLLITAGLAMVAGVAFRDSVLYPLGVDTGSPARMPTLGRVITDSAGPGAAKVLTVCVVALVVGGWAVLSRRSSTLPEVLISAAVLYFALIFVIGASRPGYLAYPIDLICLAWILSREGERS